MTFRRGGAERIFGACLILLALSPLTAPFATLDVAALLGERTAATPVLCSSQSKKPTDDFPADIATVAGGLPPPASIIESAAAPPHAADPSILRSFPLRI